MKRFLLCAVLVAWSGLASAVVYKWTDALGKVQYGDRPPAGVHAEVVELLGTHVARYAQPQRANAAPTVQTLKSTVDAPNSSSPGDTTKKTMSDDVAAVREKQCADAQDRYKKLIEGRRLYKDGANGDREYLTSEEIDSERENAKRDVDSICNSPT